MPQKIILKLLPSEAGNEVIVKEVISQTLAKNPADISGYHILKRSIDARAKAAWVNLTVSAFVNEPFEKRVLQKFIFKEVKQAKKPYLSLAPARPGYLLHLPYLSKA